MDPITCPSDTAATGPRVVLLASPGAGHLIPLAEMARRLAACHGFAVTLVTFTNLSNPTTDSAVLSSLPNSVAVAALPAVALDDLAPDSPFETIVLTLVNRSLPHLRALLRSVTSAGPLAALVPDIFTPAALTVAAELGIPGYIFFPTNLTALSVLRHLPELHRGASRENRDPTDLVRIQGCIPLRVADLPEVFLDPTKTVYAYLLEWLRQYRQGDAILANTFDEMEPATVEALKDAAAKGVFPPVHTVGPFVRPRSDEADASGCTEWLERQPVGSVLYVSFGSGGTLSMEQTAELAAGLEMSHHRFLWVVHVPNRRHDHDRDHELDHDNPLKYLPQGFVERTKDTGLAIGSWAPQVRVLAHPATAGFLSHCGWNSTLESVVSGVPMIAWPLHSEQWINAAILTEATGLALRPRAREDGMVVREEIAAVVKELMEGENGQAVRRRAKELQEAAARAWSPEGPSCRALEEVVNKWKAGVVGVRDGPSA